MRLYFRIKDNGATVFRLIDDPTKRRLDLKPIAEANHKNGSVKPRSSETLTPEEITEIEDWIEARRSEVARRQNSLPSETVEAINAAAHWFSSKPDADAAAQGAEDLLLAMHDLRAAIVRYKADSAE